MNKLIVEKLITTAIIASLPGILWLELLIILKIG